MSKYEPLADHLRELGQTSIVMTFSKIENIVGAKLPASAFKHRAWWSNNSTNSVITHAWLDAGYKTTNVDMSARTLVFRKLSSDASGRREAQEGPDSPQEAGTSAFSRIFGVLKGTVTIAPGTDLTLPTGDAWDACE